MLDSSRIRLHYMVLQRPLWFITDVKMWCDQLRRWNGSPGGPPRDSNRTNEGVLCVWLRAHKAKQQWWWWVWKKWYVWKVLDLWEEDEGWKSHLHCLLSLVPQQFNMQRDYRGGLPKPQTAALSHAGWGSLLPGYPPGGHHYETHATWWPLWKLFDKVLRWTQQLICSE